MTKEVYIMKRKLFAFGLLVLLLLTTFSIGAQVPGKYFSFTYDRFWANDGTFRTDNSIQGTSFIFKGTGAYNTAFQAGAATASKTYTLPLTDGTTGQALVTNGSAVLSWSTTTPSLLSFSSTATGLTYTNTTGVFSLTAGYVIPTTTEETNWNAAYGYVDQSVKVAGTPTFADVTVANKEITAGTGTGLTVNVAGQSVRQLYKVTLTYAGLATAGATSDHVIATLPDKTKIVAIYADTTVPYTGGTVATATLKVGNTTGGAQYIAVHDVLSGAVLKGLADADMGSEMTRAALIQNGGVVNWTTTTPVSVRLTCGTDTCDHLTAGSTTYYIITERY
jgi:hypothetical protein